MKVNMHEAKSQLSKLGKLAWEGEEISSPRPANRICGWCRIEHV